MVCKTVSRTVIHDQVHFCNDCAYGFVSVAYMQCVVIRMWLLPVAKLAIDSALERDPDRYLFTPRDSPTQIRVESPAVKRWRWIPDRS